MVATRKYPRSPQFSITSFHLVRAIVSNCLINGYTCTQLFIDARATGKNWWWELRYRLKNLGTVQYGSSVIVDIIIEKKNLKNHLILNPFETMLGQRVSKILLIWTIIISIIVYLNRNCDILYDDIIYYMTVHVIVYNNYIFDILIF